MTTPVVQFPRGVILDRDAFVWTAVPPGTALAGSSIVGTCEGDPLDLALVQVTIERGSWRRELLALGQEAPFPLDRGLALVVPGVNEIDLIAWSLSDVPIRITAHVRRSTGAARDEDGRLLRLPPSRVFQLVLCAEHGAS